MADLIISEIKLNTGLNADELSRKPEPAKPEAVKPGQPSNDPPRFSIRFGRLRMGPIRRNEV